ncbi:hypothetical protein ASPZODRAFT_469949 [Penicilliopsis zonata CBS 506.65]|uniref:Alpha-1,2-mannosyltransferase n=1 Tax=Penicilliopsis zonata CBS 506.65 TaxID=1073090 RepID=A0A1L9SX95_9EURO|nr:hypothetical protein ASPZODRAFT_469949 [Penicilliopsis zonata CBS 506.65]OJJ51825.1 hypothetical protein ASPZODRAFT_469949 [Penicilliopsis zonata CBS 506.65]
MSRQMRRGVIFLALGVITLSLWVWSHHPSEREPSSVSPAGHGVFWTEFYRLVVSSAPDCEPPTRIANAESEGFDPKNTRPAPNLLQMTDADVHTMHEAHSRFVERIRSSPPPLQYTPSTRGLVSTAGGPYLPVLVISLRMLRRTGSQLPMEVFLADWAEYDGYTCSVVLPALNARCVVLSDILDAVPGSGAQVEKYQYKLLAMLFSSFEEILFLDADAFPLSAPEAVFTSEPFLSRGLITWPDFWGSTVSPLFYEIVAMEVPAPNVRQTTESGEVFVSKRTHLRTLLLAAYYNFWGPRYYYPLLSQGAAGEGDKETFLAAAMVLNEPFYQVSEPLRALGRSENNEFMGSTMVQFDPIQDFWLTERGVWRVRGDPTQSPPRPFFIHANFPKFNPATILAGFGPAIQHDGSYTRAWQAPEEVIEAFGPGLERQFWAEIRWTACALEGKTPSWEGKEGICSLVDDYVGSVF